MVAVQRQLMLLATGVILAITLWVTFASSSVQSQALNTFRTSPRIDRELHLLLPATAANLNFCRLLLSSMITDRLSEPISIGWGGHGAYDTPKSHLFKITETLAYLRTQDSSHDEDLVLVIDAYDILMVMPPAVTISTYMELMTKSNARLQDEGIYGKSLGGGGGTEYPLLGRRQNELARSLTSSGLLGNTRGSNACESLWSGHRYVDGAESVGHLSFYTL